ncbi:hypothetical protein FHU41_002277 [Psychromicrobium silvestre]|uniref:Uncharacterized protein n=1 Tax=Psychromicrobium silvestre TaxID=1645614 RepID=A0A7Y9LUT7_9MICC|nr:HAD family hydrolase [Psychromicrobium silvestre]NYE96027.1 hypothetical protein [Psychromicrobium silvestre]
MKMVASDIDGTILGHDGAISPRTVEAFRACAAAGIEVVFVTGRPPRWLDPLREQLGHLGTVICSNGALVYDLGEEKILSTKCIPIPDLLAAREAIKVAVPSASFAAETVEGLYLEPGFLSAGDPEPLRQLPTRPLAESLKEECGVIKFLAKTEHSTADEFLAKVRPVVAPWLDATHSAPKTALLELSLRGVNKAATLSEFAASRGVQAAEVVAFGDMPNDVQMLSWSGRGYAMASGHPAAKDAANMLAPGIEDDGVAQVLERLLAVRGV